MSTTVDTSSVLIWSEGSRLAADLYRPRGGSDARPAILLCHGWGGTRDHLAKYARAFAASGFVALAFDYRGWGDSDGKLIPAADTPRLTEAGTHELTVRVIREVVDPVDHVADVRACLAWLLTEPGVDPRRVGLWGSSYGGGHVVFTAGTDDRVKAVVAQVGGYGPPKADWYRDLAYKRQADKARGNIDPPIPQGVDAPKGLKGTPDVARQWGHLPLEAARNVRVPTLIIDAEHEELNNRHEHGEAAYRTIRERAVADYHTFPGSHYEIYDRFFEPALALAIDWFRRHL